MFSELQLGDFDFLWRVYGFKRIYCEGLTQQGVLDYREKIAVLKEMEANQITRLRKQLGEVRQLFAETQPPDPDVQRLEQNILGLLQGYRLQLVEMGAAGRLLASGEIEDVLPLEDDEPLDAANPVTADGKVRFDALKVQARHDAIAKNLLKGEAFGLMILGGDHDLSESVSRLGERQCEYVRVTMKRYLGVLQK